MITSSISNFAGALYSDFLTQGLNHFFPTAYLTAGGRSAATRLELACSCSADGPDADQVKIEWLGQYYILRRPERSFTAGDRSLIQAIGRVLAARYQVLFDPAIAAKNFRLFQGLPEDRYISAFLDPDTYADIGTLAESQDRIADAIEALRASSLSTYENRRVSAGVLLLGRGPRDAAPEPVAGDTLRYSSALTSIRSFFHLCDGMQTVALADLQGYWIDIVDLESWAESRNRERLSLPSASVYAAHCLATLHTSDLCLVLTLNGEIKIFARGMQVLSLLNGRWRLTDMASKYRQWREAVADDELAGRILQVALDMAESRRGALFVVLDDADSVNRLVAPGDLLNQGDSHPASGYAADSKRAFYYLLRGKRIDKLAPSVLRTLAAIDGGIVLDQKGNLLAFGAILQHHHDGRAEDSQRPEGGRSVAALAASHFGKALKVSEDGMISFFNHGRMVWEL